MKRKITASVVAFLVLMASPAHSRIVTDMLGRSVELPDTIERVAATSSVARLLTYGDCADRLVGVTRMDQSNKVAMPYTAVNAAHFSTLAVVGAGGSKDEVYYEALASLDVQVIFTNRPGSVADTIFEKTGIPVVALVYSGIFDQSLYDALTLLGEIMGTEDRSAKVVAAMKEWEADLRARTADVPKAERPTVYAGAVSFRGGHGFEGTYAHYPPFVAVNAQNVVDQTGQDGPFMIDMEKVLSLDPQIIFLNPANMRMVQEDYRKRPEIYDSFSAVKNGQVFAQLPYNYNSTNVELAIADAYYAGMVIYPDRFKDLDMKKKADEIFTLLLGEPFYDRLDEAGLRFGSLEIGGPES